MSKTAAILLLLLVGVGCGTAPTPQNTPPAVPAASIVVQDTVKVVDSAALSYLYRREKRLSEQLGTTMELLRSYVEQESRLNERMQVLSDSVELLKLQQQQRQHTGERHALQMAAQVAELEQLLRTLQDSMAVITAVTAIEVAPSVVGKVDADTIALLEEKAAWLAAQPRTIHTVGAEDDVNDVELINAHRFAGYLFVAIATSEGSVSSAQLNGALPVVAKNGVFVYGYPTLPKVLIEVTAGGRQYAIKTTTKKLK